MLLDIKERRPILHLVLADDAYCLKDHFVLLDAVAKSHVKAPEILQPPVKRLMTRPSATLELLNIRMILGVRRINDCFLPTVSLVSNSFLAGGDFVLEGLAQDSDVRFCSRKRAIHPNKTILENRKSKIVVHTCLIEFVGVVLRVFRESRVLRFIDATMHAVHRDDDDGVVIIIDRWISRSPLLGPNNL